MQRKLISVFLLLILAVLLFGCTNLNQPATRAFTESSNISTVTTSQPSCDYTYTDWAPTDCPANEIQTRTLTNSPADCVGKPILIQACNYQNQNSIASAQNNRPCDSLEPSWATFFEGQGYNQEKGEIVLGKPLSIRVDFRPEFTSQSTMPSPVTVDNNPVDNTVLDYNLLSDKLKITIQVFGLCSPDGLLCGEGNPTSKGFFSAECIISKPASCKSDSASFEVTLERIDGCESKVTGSIGKSISNSGINDENVNYKFTSYSDYAKFIQNDLEKKIGIVFTVTGPAYGGNEGIENSRKDGKVYFIMFQHGDWESTRYWAVEVNAETGELLKYVEVTGENNQIDLNKLWWLK
ncbi:MAG: hypothetical protein WCW13_03480 [archaeon]|jgi:hypothetical protein